METREIVRVLRTKKSGSRRDRALRMSAVYLLYQKGYKSGHIAKAFKVGVNTIEYECKTIQNLIDIGDECVKEAFNILKTHLFEIRPYFVKKDELFRIETYLIIDNTKL